MTADSPLSMIPERKLHWSSFAASFSLQLLMLIVLVEIGIVQPQQLLPAKKSYTLTALVSTPPPQRPAVRPPKRLETPVEPMVVAKLTAPMIRTEVRERPTELAPRPQMPRPELSQVLPTAPRRAPAVQVVRTGGFGSTGSQAIPTTARPAREVQTGGFGDPNGIKGIGKGAKATIASLGSFDLPSGPGYGNGTGGARGIRGTVASVGFGNGVAIGNSDRTVSGTARGAIQQGGFGDARAVVDVARAPKPKLVAATSTPVQIISKPNPIYTDEARALRLEGEVLLEVAFLARGECQVVRVLRGLGHGLDEAAIRAAQKISFRPAMRDGEPVDSTASIHVVFQLAY